VNRIGERERGDWLAAQVGSGTRGRVAELSTAMPDPLTVSAEPIAGGPFGSDGHPPGLEAHRRDYAQPDLSPHRGFGLWGYVIERLWWRTATHQRPRCLIPGSVLGWDPPTRGRRVVRAWIFQANPDRFDLEGALAALDTIRWRVPQRASEIVPGDPVVIWRSGRDAGIVGLGRVIEPPREATSNASEQPYDRESEGGLTTRATLRVKPCPFIGKAEVAAIPELADHQIVTAPMGTVFPLGDEEWRALRHQLPEPPEAETPQASTWPAAFSWEQRTKSINPLPGGIDAYQDVLVDIAAHIDATQPAREELKDWLASRYQVSERRAALVAGFLGRAGLLRLDSARVALTPDGERWLHERDPAFLLALIHGRVRYVGEMLAHLDTPRTTEQLLNHANEAYGMRWTSRGQITRRRQVLGGLGAIDLDDEGRLTRTPFGEEALQRLDLAPPQQHRHTPSPDTLAERSPPKRSTAPPHLIRQPRAEEGALTAGDLAARLLLTAHDSTNPTAFEHAARDAFAFLGFDAVWHGGAGRTDVLLTAPLGTRGQYRVVVDTKSTAHEAVNDQQIDWVTIDEHQDRYEADHACILAPAFRGGRVIERSRSTRSVALLDVAALSDVLRQHEVAPLDLHAYRALFVPEQGPDEVIDQGEALRRELVLAAEIVRQVASLEGDEGVVTGADLYWNLDAFAEQFEGQRAEREEIERVAEALARSPLSLLRKVNDGYTSLGSISIQTRRLRLLADLVGQGVPETSEDP
jgi:hypothetical protein